MLVQRRLEVSHVATSLSAIKQGALQPGSICFPFLQDLRLIQREEGKECMEMGGEGVGGRDL